MPFICRWFNNVQTIRNELFGIFKNNKIKMYLKQILNLSITLLKTIHKIYRSPYLYEIFATKNYNFLVNTNERVIIINKLPIPYRINLFLTMRYISHIVKQTYSSKKTIFWIYHKNIVNRMRCATKRKKFPINSYYSKIYYPH